MVYVVMAACGTQTMSSRPTDNTSGAGGAVSVYDAGGPDRGAGGATGSPDVGVGGATLADSSLGGLLDALTNPVPEAAAALPPDIATEACSVQVVVPPSTAGGMTMTYYYAVHNYPGKSITDLATVHVVLHVSAATSLATFPPGYENAAYGYALVKAGAVAVNCGMTMQVNNGSVTDTRTYDSVTFILPSI
jgi:hypothetical protein